MAEFDDRASKWRLTVKEKRLEVHIYGIYYAMTKVRTRHIPQRQANTGCERVAFELWDDRV